jgi:hypothetical protein
MRAGDETMTVAETKQYNQVGRSVPRVDADEKVRGLAVYADDVPLPGCWYAEVVRSPVLVRAPEETYADDVPVPDCWYADPRALSWCLIPRLTGTACAWSRRPTFRAKTSWT